MLNFIAYCVGEIAVDLTQILQDYCGDEVTLKIWANESFKSD